MSQAGTPLANVITLGAGDLPALRDVCRRLGWPQVMDGEDYAAFELRGVVLALFPLEKLADDGRAEPESGRGASASRSASSPTPRKRSTSSPGGCGRRARHQAARGRGVLPGALHLLRDPEDNFWEIAWAGAGNPIVAAARAVRD